MECSSYALYNNCRSLSFSLFSGRCDIPIQREETDSHVYTRENDECEVRGTFFSPPQEEDEEKERELTFLFQARNDTLLKRAKAIMLLLDEPVIS